MVLLLPTYIISKSILLKQKSIFIQDKKAISNQFIIPLQRGPSPSLVFSIKQIKDKPVYLHIWYIIPWSHPFKEPIWFV